jgi:large subunit ribosomal protein L31e
MKKEGNEEKEPEIEEESPEEQQEQAPETTEEFKEIEEEVEKEATEAKEEELPPAEEEEKPPKEEKKKAEEEEEIVEERFYTIPLSRAWIMPANKRAPRAIRILKSFVTKHMKLGVRKEVEGEEEEEPGRLIIDNEVNLRIWNRGIEKPPRNIRVRAAKDKDGNVTVYLAEGD